MSPAAATTGSSGASVSTISFGVCRKTSRVSTLAARDEVLVSARPTVPSPLISGVASIWKRWPLVSGAESASGPTEGAFPKSIVFSAAMSSTPRR